jgi:hypothetical protein
MHKLVVLGLGTMGLIAAGGIYLWPLTGSGIWISGDSPFYLAVAYAVEENLRNGQGLWGWSMHDLGGFPVFSLFIPSILGIIAIVAAQLGALLSLPVAYKMMVGIAVLLPALSLWVVLMPRVGVWEAFFIGNLALLLTYHVLQPLNGGWGAYLAVGLLWLSVSVGESWFRDRPTWQRSLVTVILASAVALSDVSAWIVLPCAVVALSLVYGVRSGNGKRVTGWAVLVLGPLIIWLSLLMRGGGVTWGSAIEGGPSSLAVLLRLPGWFVFPGSSELLTEDLIPLLQEKKWGSVVFLTGRLICEHIPELLLCVLAFCGATKVLKQRSELPDQLRLWGVAHLFLVALLLSAMLLPRQTLAGWVAPPERLVPYVNMALLTVGAIALTGLRVHAAPFCLSRTMVLLLVGLIPMHGMRYATYGERVLLKTADQSVVYAELSDVWWYLRFHVVGTPTGVLYETLEGVGFLDGRTSSNLAALSTRETGLPSLASWKIPALSSVRRPPILAGDYPLQRLARLPEIMRRWNCLYLVVWWPGRREALRTSGAFEIVHESPNRLFTVLRLRDYSPCWLEFAQPVQQVIQEEALPGGYFRFSVENPQVGNRAILKITYHPGWRLWVNRRAVPLAAVGDQIATEILPAGFLELTFSFLAPWQFRN